MKKRTVLGLLILFILLVCFIVLTKSFESNESEYLTITKAKPNDLFSEDKLTSVGVINEFFKSLNNGNVEILNEQYSKDYFESTDLKNGYSEFLPQNISNIKVKLLNKSSENDKYYEVIFTIIDNSAPPFIIAGSGEQTYFFNIIFENGDWKINDIATSP